MKTTSNSRTTRLLNTRILTWPIGVIHPGCTALLTKVVMSLAVVLLLMSLSPLVVHAQTLYYVRAGAAGSNNGADWNNAYTSLPSTLVRGATYYVADGNYSRYTFTTPMSGSAWITIKKATESDHGTSTGWQTTYGDGQAVFGPLSVNSSSTGYIEIDGQFKYGFKVDFDEGQTGFEFNSGAQNIHLKYIDFDGVATSGNYNYSASTKAIYVHSSGSVTTDGFLLSNCALHGGETLIQWEKGNNAIIEYCDFYDNRSTASNWHSNIMYITGTSTNVIFRYNKIHNYNVEGLFVTGYGGSNSGNWYIYGNVFYDGVDVARGLELRQDYSYGAFYFYNNTCINLPVGCVNILGSTTGSQGRNNIGYNAGFNWGRMSNSNNSSVPSSIFVNYSAKNFDLASPTEAGYSLPSPYNVDPNGKIRGADGVWDMGAYEYGPGGTNMPSPPKNLKIMQ